MCAAVDVGDSDGDGFETETKCGDDSVVEDVTDIGLGGEEAESGGVVLRGGRLYGGDAEVFVGLGEASAGGEKVGLGVGGDGCVAIEDDVAVRSDAGGVDLRDCERGEKGDKESGQARDASAKQAGVDHSTTRFCESGFDENGHAAPRCCAEVCIGAARICISASTVVCYYFGLSLK